MSAQKPAQECSTVLLTKHRKQPRWSSVGEWINKLWHIHTIEYHSAIKRNELSRHGKTRRNFKCLSLSERGQSEKSTYCMSPTLRHSRKGKTEKISGCQGFWGWERRDAYGEHKGFSGQSMDSA